MSQIWSCLRGDVAPEVQATEKQDFVRTTTKYWGAWRWLVDRLI